MPELPEVETTCRGIAPHVEGRRVEQVIVREVRLRWPVPPELPQRLAGQNIEQVQRRAKYLLLRTASGTAIFHLGMSGSLRILPIDTLAEKHDHVDLLLSGDVCLRLRDPRRFGALLWTDEDPLQHPLLAALGPEPLGEMFTGDFLYRASRGRRVAIKSFLMNSQVVVGVGNIYANEALFMTGIHPARAAGRISRERYRRLVHGIRHVLTRSIAQGGTTLRDFLKSDGKPGYFQLALRVYGRDSQPCPHCGKPIQQQRIGQRSTFYCARCQR